jgi:2-succinyl-5-enolpyruvyl-6-hydroxy-3-cyclohexene-1-carboxylate synthase
MDDFSLSKDEYIIIFSSKFENNLIYVYATTKKLDSSKKWYYKFFDGNIVTLYPYVEISNNCIQKNVSNEKIEDFINIVNENSIKQNKLIKKYKLNHNLTELEHEEKVEYIKSNCKKVVLSRVTDVILEDFPNMNNVFNNMLKGEKCYHILLKNKDDTWISNTPESLFRRHNNTIIIESIAGTVPKVNNEEQNKINKELLLNDTKLIEEQQIVVDWFYQQINDVSKEINILPVEIIDCGYVYHRKNNITIELNDNISNIDIIQKLHPSPAICGYPYNESNKIIKSIEEHKRELYTGCIGYENEEDSEFAVMIRICKNSKNSNIISLYTGGGIIKDSKPSEEWKELNQKLLFFKHCLKDLPQKIFWSNVNNINQVHSKAIMREFKNQGLDYVCISPGYRSSNLAIMAKEIFGDILITYDERSMSYHALGYSKSTKNPAIIITTSGTAIANLFPATLEAYYTNTPLIICTADRPTKLHDTDANQTINQHDFFNKYSHWSFNLPKPENNRESLKLWVSTISYASNLAKKNNYIIHLNIQFDDPLYPKYIEWDKNIINYNPFNKYINYTNEIKDIKNALVIVGNVTNNNFIKEQRIPILLDISYGNLYDISNHNIIEYGELFVEKYFNILINRVETLIIYGDHIISKNYKRLIKYFDFNIIWCTNNDLQIDEFRLSKKITNTTIYGTGIEIKDLESIIINNNEISKMYNNIFSAMTSEILFISNSSPIRDINKYVKWYKYDFPIYFNRGCSGIDGIISTVIGISNGLKKSCVLIIGDISFCYDINGLDMIKKNKYPIKIICLNNNGGKIFDRLPLKSMLPKSVFEELFTTKPNVSIKNISKAFSINYYLIKSDEKIIFNKKNESLIMEILI